MPKPYHFRTDAEWEHLICTCKSSGLSDYRWCIEHEIPLSSFYRHLRKFHNTMSPVTAGKSSPEASLADPVQEVVPLMVIDNSPKYPSTPVPSADRVPAARLYVNGMTIELFDHAAPVFLRGILDAASSIC